MSDQADLTYLYQPSGNRRLKRKYLIPITMSMGFLVGFCASVAVRSVRDIAAEDTAWKRGTIVCVGESHAGGTHAFRLENRGKRDYHVTDRSMWRIFGRTPNGLEPAPDARLSIPVFIPRGERVLVRIECSTHSQFAVYDGSTHSRIDLCGGRP